MKPDGKDLALNILFRFIPAQGGRTFRPALQVLVQYSTYGREVAGQRPEGSEIAELD